MFDGELWILYIVGCCALAFVAKTLAEIAHPREEETWFAFGIRWCMFAGGLMVWIPGAGACLRLGVKLIWGE
jgi:hypothetical protein